MNDELWICKYYKYYIIYYKSYQNNINIMNDEIVSELSNLCLRTVKALSSDNCREMNQRQKK